MYQLLSITELARATGVPHPTLRGWVLRGWITPFAQTEGGVYYFTKESVAEVVAVRQRQHRYRKDSVQ